MRAAGNDIQALGATIEGIGALYLAKDQRDFGQAIQIAGGWGQVAGVVMQAIAVTKRLVEEEEIDFNDVLNKLRYRE
ncbi:MAG: hypothetical protein LRY71_13950 [Bacillaceae bacterium]|nr:hypothetical protein [Bacillaceae bacterium]